MPMNARYIKMNEFYHLRTMNSRSVSTIVEGRSRYAECHTPSRSNDGSGASLKVMVQAWI